MEDPHPKVGDALSLLQKSSPPCSEPHLPGAAVPSLFLSSICHGHRTILYRKLHVAQVENLPPSLSHTHTDKHTHMFWSPTRNLPTHGRLNKGCADTGRWFSGPSQSTIRPNRRC